MQYISTDQVAWIGFKTDNLPVGIHIFKVNSTIHLLLDIAKYDIANLFLQNFLQLTHSFLIIDIMLVT